jgi:DNA-binding NtrC family response regulator
MSATGATQVALFAGSAVLLVDDDPSVREPMAAVLRSWGLQVSEAGDLRHAKSLLRRGGFGCVVMDKCLPDGDGFRFALDLRSKKCDFDIVVLTGAPEPEEALTIGGRFLGYLRKPFDYEQLREFMWGLLAASENEIQPETNFLPRRVEKHSRREVRLIGNCEEMIAISNEIAKLARMNTSCVILGNSGCGKEVVARKIHDLSGRRTKRFVAVNCGAIPETLIESELFGYAKGSFTGADTRGKTGRFEEADGGTIFLDEITEMPLSFQTRLLRVLQEGRLLRLGATEETEVDVRVIAATNRDLEGEVKAGRFREDLYFRLRGSEIYLPQLRDRGHEDIALLIKFFAQRAVDEVERGVVFSRSAWAALLAYEWPGNVRELENVVRHAVQSCNSGVVLVSDLSRQVRAAVAAKKSQDEMASEQAEIVASAVRSVLVSPEKGEEVRLSPEEITEILSDVVKDTDEGKFPNIKVIQERAVDAAMVRSRGNVSLAARLLGVDRKYIDRRVSPRWKAVPV